MSYPEQVFIACMIAPVTLVLGLLGAVIYGYIKEGME